MPFGAPANYSLFFITDSCSPGDMTTTLFFLLGYADTPQEHPHHSTHRLLFDEERSPQGASTRSASHEFFAPSMMHNHRAPPNA